jgi:hypothetical protein
MKYLLIIAILTACQCNSWTSQDTQTAVEVTGDILQVVAAALARADKALEQCERYTVEESEIREKARFDCGRINGQKEYVERLRDDYGERSISEGDLRIAAEHLDIIIDESGLIK